MSFRTAHQHMHNPVFQWHCVGNDTRLQKHHLDARNATPGNRNLVAGGLLVQVPLPECRLMCSSSECLVVSALLHTVQVYGRSPVCILLWTCKECFWAKPFPHSLHLKGRSPVIKAKKHGINKDLCTLPPKLKYVI